MEDSYKIKNILKASTILIIAFALIMPGSAAVFNISNEDLAKPGEGQGRLGTTIYVDDDNTEGPWDGTLEHPYQYIQDGIDNANNGDEVYVFNGTYNENVVVFRSIHLVGEDKDITIIDGGGDGTVVRLTADGVYLTDFTIKNSGNDPNNAGINVNSEWNHIAVTNVVNNNYGIRLVEPHNDVYFNNFLGNIENAYDDSSNNIFENYWDDYIGVDDDEDGIGDTPYDITGDSNKDWCPLIHIYGSVKNLDTEEVFITIQNAINDGDTSSGHTISVKNDVYYEHVCIHKSINLIGEDNEETIIDARETDTVVRICDDSVYLTGFTIQNSGDDLHDAGMHVTSDENTIKENIIQNNYHGFYINLSSDDNEIFRNIIRDNEWNGIYIKSLCEGNIIFENTIENNGYGGIGIAGSSYNEIYHNNFIDNLHNAYDDSNNLWDDDYPSGGNYWSDYTGTDNDGDGIGDTPYDIADGINEDRYPLIEPYTGVDNTPPNVEIISPQNGIYIRNHRLLPFLLRQRTIIFGAIDIAVEASDVQSGIERIEFYTDDDPNPKAIDYDEPYGWTWKRGSLLKHKHTIIVVAFDNADNYNIDMITVRKYF